MGVIKDGEVSGFIPTKEAFAVHYPGYPSSISRAIQTLGGTPSIQKARSSESNKLELHFRPEDPYSHPAFGELLPSNHLLLKISIKKNSHNHNHDHDHPPQQHVCADIVARVPQAYHFRGMADYQHVVALHAHTARTKNTNLTQMKERHFEKAGFMDLDQDDVMILLPPLFSLKDAPEETVLKPPHTSGSKRKQEDTTENQFEMNFEPALAIDFNIKASKQIPKEINWKQCIKPGSEEWKGQMAVSELFEERPIWPKESLTERLLDKGLKFRNQMLKRHLLTVAYYFSSGPFLRFWIRKGYDPRKDPDSRIYQRIDFRVPPPLRSYCDANTSDDLKNRWEDLCKFRIFPFKCQTSLQLYELDDDYIQQEITKPPKQTSCTYATGWFSQHLLDSLRLRLMLRFLSVYPKAGAEKLLKSASEDFEKSKRACIYKDSLKPDREQHQQDNTQVIGDEVDEDHTVDDGNEDEIESDDQEEELDAYESLNLEGEEGEISLESHLYMENNSKSYLQELFYSFPPLDTGDKMQDFNNSDEEYQIYEQDDEDYPDDD